MQYFILLFLVLIDCQLMLVNGQAKFVGNTDGSGRFKRADGAQKAEELGELIEDLRQVDQEVEQRFEDAKEDVIQHVGGERAEKAVDSINEAEENVKQYARRFLFDMFGRASAGLSGGINSYFNPTKIERIVDSDRNSTSSMKGSQDDDIIETSKIRGKGSMHASRGHHCHHNGECPERRDNLKGNDGASVQKTKNAVVSNIE